MALQLHTPRTSLPAEHHHQQQPLPAMSSSAPYDAALQAERHAREAVEAELAAARKTIDHLRSVLSRREACGACAPMQSRCSSAELEPALSGAGASQPAEPTTTSAGSSGMESDDCKDDVSARHGVKQDKEILSHCSDISASKTELKREAPAPSAQAPRKRSKTSASDAPRRAQKTKKEREKKPKIPGQSRYWTPEEHKLFLEAINKFGHKDLRQISAYVGTRNMTQVRTHSQKYFMRLMREAKRQNPMQPAAQDDANSKDGNVAFSNVSQQSSQNGHSTTSDQNEDALGDKYSVPNTCGMTLLCLVGQDTLTN